MGIMAEKKSIKDTLKKAIQYFQKPNKKKDKSKNDQNTANLTKSQVEDVKVEVDKIITNETQPEITCSDATKDTRSESESEGEEFENQFGILPAKQDQNVDEDDSDNFRIITIQKNENVRTGSESSESGIHDIKISDVAENLNNLKIDNDADTDSDDKEVFNTITKEIDPKRSESEESGIYDTKVDSIVDDLDKLKIKDEKEVKDEPKTTEAKKKKQKVLISRGKMKTTINVPSTTPYPKVQVNQQSFSGGLVVENRSNYLPTTYNDEIQNQTLTYSTEQNYREDIALQSFYHTDHVHETNYQDVVFQNEITTEINYSITDDQDSLRLDETPIDIRYSNEIAEAENEIEECIAEYRKKDQVSPLLEADVLNKAFEALGQHATQVLIYESSGSCSEEPLQFPPWVANENPQQTVQIANVMSESYIGSAFIGSDDAVTNSSFRHRQSSSESEMPNYPRREHDFPTPPPSFGSDQPSPGSYQFSPMNNPDLESWRQLPNVIPEERTSTKRHMKDYKKKMIALNERYSKMSCCQDKKGRDFFLDAWGKMEYKDRVYLSTKVARYDLSDNEEVLRAILTMLSKIPELTERDRNFQFGLIFNLCEKILDLHCNWYLDDFGLSILRVAAIICYQYPMVTKYIVDNIYKAYDAENNHADGPIFTESNPTGDTLVLACARHGDSHADVLAALVDHNKRNLPPLFDYNNYKEGRNALHVACFDHSKEASRLHVVHVLLKHADISLRIGDIHGGDTPLHLAVNSPTCDLDLIMLIFQHVDPKAKKGCGNYKWKELVNLRGREGGPTPKDYAKKAKTGRANFPEEIVDFFDRCR